MRNPLLFAFLTTTALLGGACYEDDPFSSSPNAASLPPVATVTVVPESASIVVGDSAIFHAQIRDSAGTLLTGPSVSWLTADTATILVEHTSDTTATVRARVGGTAVLSATSEGKTGQATITVP